MEKPVEDIGKVKSVKFLKNIVRFTKKNNNNLEQIQNLENTNTENENNAIQDILNCVNQEENVNVPAKVSTWSKIKAFLFQEIRFGFKPKTEVKLQEAHNFWHQDVTTEKVHSFLFQKIKFGK